MTSPHHATPPPEKHHPLRAFAEWYTVQPGWVCILLAPLFLIAWLIASIKNFFTGEK